MGFRIVLVLVLVWGLCACMAVPKYSEFFGGNTPGNCTSDYSCAAEGDSCSPSGSCSEKNGTCCAPGLWCISGTCETDTLGDACNTTTPCFPKITAGYKMSCVNNMCTYVYGPGDTCTNTTDCLFGLNCSSTCQGLTQGQTCNVLGFQGGCNYGLICAMNVNGTKVCMNTTAAGSNCTATTHCAKSSVCFNGVCTSQYSLSEGAKCMATLCDEDYVCSSNGTCISADTDLTSCSSNNDCSNGQTCKCSQFTGDSYCDDPYLDPCTEEASDLNSCLASSSCFTQGDAPNSCCYNNCYSEYKKSLSCTCDSATDTGGSCFYNPYCGGFPVWAIIVIIVVAIVLVLAVVLLVFFMMRRRRQYDSI